MFLQLTLVLFPLFLLFPLFVKIFLWLRQLAELAGWQAAWLDVAGGCMASCLAGGQPSQRNQYIIFPKHGKTRKSGKRNKFQL